MVARKHFKAFGCPMRIPIRELGRYGITIEDAQRLLNARDADDTSTGP
jgi:hypothetical protein